MGTGAHVVQCRCPQHPNRRRRPTVRRRTRFPERLLADAGHFDQLVAELADKAASRRVGSLTPSLGPTFRRFAVHPEDQEVLARTFDTMCRLHDQGRDHIWGYYVRNLARPVWLSQPANRVDVLVGNPPWLSYRFMTTAMQQSFAAMSRERGLWAGAAVATHQDLSGLFVVRCVELYLRDRGRFGFVMPLAALSRRQFAGFRTGDYQTQAEPIRVAFDQPWDLHKVKPSFFPVPPSVVFGQRTSGPPASLSLPPEAWSGRLPNPNVSRAIAGNLLTRAAAGQRLADGAGSLYGPRFAQGASVVPRMLFMVEAAPTSALGTGAGRRAVQSQRSPNEKRPWRNLPPLQGVVESQFVRPLHLGETVLPFRSLPPRQAIISWDGQALLDGSNEQLEYYPGLAAWWRSAESLWARHRSSDRLSLGDQLNFRNKLTQEFPTATHRVVYSKGGMYLAAARLSDPSAVIDHTLYWAAVTDADEARYLTAILNSQVLAELVRPLQARGEHNPRHFDKYVFQIPIPLYDPDDRRHLQLVELAAVAERVAGSVELPDGVSFQALRRRIRLALSESGIAEGINALVSRLLSIS
jgi:hypothetical protein